jgi:D-alanyl-D-alanine-carboxypeptidase/D-alanyl-D-alanine-endopeptidase
VRAHRRAFAPAFDDLQSGFMTYVVLSPNRKLGVFVMASRVNFAMFENLRSAARNLAAELAPAGP